MGEPKGACIAFLYPVCSQKEWDDFHRGVVPSHRLWGQVEMERQGWTTRMCPPGKGFLARDSGWRWLLWQTFWLWKNRHTVQAAFAVQEVSALFVLFLRVLGVVRLPVVVLNFGLLHPKNTRGMRRLMWKVALHAASGLVSLVEGQIPEIQNHFAVSRDRQFYVPLGVDLEFVRRRRSQVGESRPAEEGYLLAVGTNEGKDYGTLLEALPLGLRLIIVTDSYNAQIIRKHRCYGAGIEVLQGVPIQRLRELYQNAALVLIPLHDTPYGSGHTVFLENLALGKILVVSGSRGMQGYAREGVNCLRVKVGDTLQLRETIQAVMKEPNRYQGMGQAAWKDAEDNFSIEKFAAGMSRVIWGAMRASGSGPEGEEGKEQTGGLEKGGKHASV